MRKRYVPDRGDVVRLSFTPPAGHEQGGRRHALTISPALYNERAGLALFCPITTRVKGYPFEVPIPKGMKASGVVLTDQVKNLDWRARKAVFCCRLPKASLFEVIQKIGALIL